MEKKYWDDFYNSKVAPVQPSNFAKFITENYLEKCDYLYDLGCGNARDTFYFASQGVSCIGIDQSDAAIEVNRNKIPPEIKNIRFEIGDFPSFKYEKDLDEKISIYSRFTLHSINYEEETILLDNLISLKNLDMLFIEVRSIHDEIYGDGDEVGKHEFITSHYRRFIYPEILKSQLQAHFDLKYFVESQGFSKTDESDPCLIRVVAKRKNIIKN